MSNKTRPLTWALMGLILANFLAQVPYFLHLYYTPQHPLPALAPALTMGTVFAAFVIPAWLFLRGRRPGYSLLIAFLAVDFLFYLWNISGGAIHGLGLFFHLRDSDPILWAVNFIGYLNFFAAGWLLLRLAARKA